MVYLFFMMLGAGTLYGAALAAGAIRGSESQDAAIFRAIDRYSGNNVKLQWRSIDLHGFGASSIVVLVRPSLPPVDRFDLEEKVRPSLIILDRPSTSFLDRMARREPGYVEAYRLTLAEPSDLPFGWDASLRLIESEPDTNPFLVVEWSTSIADDTLRAVTLTSWRGRYSTAFLPNPFDDLGIGDPFPQLGHPTFRTADGADLDGWYLNSKGAYEFYELDGDSSVELAVTRALEFIPGYTYDGECRACAHRYAISVYDTDSAMGFSKNTEWNQFLDGKVGITDSRNWGQAAVTDVVDLKGNLADFMLSEVRRRASPWWPKLVPTTESVGP